MEYTFVSFLLRKLKKGSKAAIIRIGDEISSSVIFIFLCVMFFLPNEKATLLIDCKLLIILSF